MKITNFLLFFYMIVAMPTYASDLNTANSVDATLIRTNVETFLKSEIDKHIPAAKRALVNIQVRNLDKRLRLSPCDKALTLNLQGKQIRRSTSVKVSCTGNKPWSIYTNSTISLEMPIVSLNQELPRGHVLQAKDLLTIPKDIYSLRDGYSTQPETVIGQELKRALRTGDVVYSYHLQAPDLIKKGDRVTVIARRGGLSVISHGIALSDASRGEKVRVENQRSERIIQAKVVGPGQVEVL